MVVRAIGNLLLIAAAWSLLSIVVHRPWVLAGADLLGMLGMPSEPSLFVFFLVLALAGAMRRRLRPAHTVLVVLMALNALTTMVVLIRSTADSDFLNRAQSVRGYSHDYAVLRTSIPFNTVALIIEIAVLILVILVRRRFVARVQRGSTRSAVSVLVGGLAISFGVALTLVTFFPRGLEGMTERVRFAFRSALGLDTGPDSPGMHGHLGYDWIYGLAGALSAAALILALLVLWRSARGQQMQSADEELQVRRLLLQYGEDDSLGYFATRRDKAVIFSPDGEAALTYRNEGSVSVASADPIGRRSSWAPVIEAWLQQCREHGRYAAVLSSSEDGSKAYVAAGLRAFALGDEAIIDVDDFSLRGRTMRPVRQAVTRISRAGYTTRVRRHADLSSGELEQIEQLAQKWRGEEAERGFSMALNRLGDPADGRCVLITAHDQTGEIRGFLSFVPWGVRGVSLDLMRRDRDAENGLNEYLVAKLIEHGPEFGIRRISLNFAVFRNVFQNADQVGAGPITKITDACLSFASRFYQLETLYRANDKYRPEWVPRLLCYDPALTVPRAGIAMGVAEGFLPPLGPAFLVGPRPSEHQPPRPEPDFVQRVREQESALLIAAPPAQPLSEQQRVRRDKLQVLEAAGMPAYPVQVPRSDRVAGVRERHGELGPDQLTDDIVAVTGRVRAWRDLGGVTFAVLEDDGALIQVMTTRDGTPEPVRTLWRRAIDLGDLVSVTGPVATSRNGELSVLVQQWQMAAKCLSPLPSPRAPLSDDVRVRNRSLDLLTNPGALEVLRKRSLAVRAIRELFTERGFLEVETPMLQSVHGGATARPFKTHINAYGMDLYLRIAPELYLKRLAVGGMQKIFEVGRNFRNEGADATHNPEFTSCEAYEAYGDYTTMRVLMRELVLRVATAIHGRPISLRPNGAGGFDEVDLSPQWPVKTVHDAVSEAVGVRLTSASGRDEVAAVCQQHGVAVRPEDSAGKLVMELYEALVEKQTTFPTFYCDFPVEVSFLARKHRTDPRLTEQWDLVAFGAELGTAYSELTDPVDQRDRLTRQSMAAAAGDPEAMEVDESFLAALELAMPPTGGLGFGVDRLVMTLLGTTIKPTLAFPFVRPQGD
ncbi:bifunctional lysylphosphatidylglycerol synthetase/lysine--tRNA ligase LysX [Calidifontibacter sp. DB0510]|uniref:Lysine--tRNA ligase n=1 Tax=Metallococcus carri TaxID=1656884 RepID=A0A967B0S5_9MICO|nr:bifunctional lysylphosphatidylglycerol synthetase/lysine--tRNA ligase LysX [Metallococcus carri]NOP38990.1 bifunctional lysylphosphatidylglycerol synthetase/lysine--tRNA ligase LysX [Calidifontibacter sp. DB2511S]